MDTCIYMAESLCSLPKTTATLLISHIPIQNKKVSLKNVYFVTVGNVISEQKNKVYLL